jgi:enoyl-CoA hydratase
MAGTVRLTRRGAILEATLDHPPLNTIDSGVLDGLETLLREARDETVRAVMITGSRLAFSSGAEVALLEGISGQQARALAERGQAVFRRIEALPVPVVAAVQGFCFGGGMELALACHIRVASERARFALPEVNLGIHPGFGGTWRSVRAMGRGEALMAMLTGDPVPARRALELGWVQAVWPPREFDREARGFVDRLADRPPEAVRSILRLVRRAAEGTPDERDAREAASFARTIGTEEARRRIAAFLEKERSKGRSGRER